MATRTAVAAKAGKLITTLSDAQRARFPDFVEKWVRIGLSTAPADRERAERAIKGMYGLAQLREPRVVWLPCPVSAAMAAVQYAGLTGAARLGETARLSVGSAVGSAVDSAVGSAVDSAVRSAVGSAVDSAVRSAVDSAVRSAVDSAVRSAVGSAVDSAVRSAVDSAVRSAVDSAVGSAVGSAVRSAVGSAVDSAVRSAVDSAVGSAVDSAVRSAVGSAVDSAVRSAVRSAVDSAVRSAVDSAVGSAVGSAVDSAVGSARLKERLTDRMLNAGYAYFGGSLWAGAWWGWYDVASCDFYREVLGVEIDRHYSEAAESCGYYWLLDDICFASERPSRIHRDGQGRLHCEDGQSIGYPSGWGLWHINGVQVPQLVVERPDLITLEMIGAEQNAEVRRVMIERYKLGEEVAGIGAYVRDAGGECLDYDEQWGKLWRREVPGDEPIVTLEVTNRSPEPDGHFRTYFLRVEPELRPLPPGDWANVQQREFLRKQRPQKMTAKNAVASLHGLRGEEYAPLVET